MSEKSTHFAYPLPTARMICATYSGSPSKGYRVYSQGNVFGPFKTLQEASAEAARRSIIISS